MSNFDSHTISLKRVETGIGFCFGYYITDPDTNQDIEVATIYKSLTKFKEIDGEKYDDDRYYTIKSCYENCERIPGDILDLIFQEAFMHVLSHDFLIEILPYDKFLTSYMNRFEDKELVSEIDLIALDGEYDVNEEVLCKFIEKPVRKVCTDLTNYGVKTLMSSCNKKNIYNPLVKDDEFLFIGHYDTKDKEAWKIGNGYAWIMIDWDSLNDENRAYFINLHDQEVPCNLNDTELNRLRRISDGRGSNIVKFYEYQKVDEFLNSIIEGLNDSRKYQLLTTISHKSIGVDKNYDSRSSVLYGCNSLNNHGSRFRTLVLRYPVDENTKISEVENYFDGITKTIMSNQPKQDICEQKILDF